MPGLEFSGQLSENDFKAINALIVRKGLIATVMCLLAFTILIIWNAGLRSALWDPSTGIVISSTFAIVSALFVKRWIARRRWGRDKILQQPIRGTVSEDGIDWGVEGFSPLHIPWDSLVRYRESAGIVLLTAYLVVSQAHHFQIYYFFPGYFSGESEWQQFRELVVKELPRKGRPRRRRSPESSVDTRPFP